MAMTLSDFTEVIQFMGRLFYGGFQTLQNSPVYSDGGTTISMLDIIIGLFLINILVDLLLIWIWGQ